MDKLKIIHVSSEFTPFAKAGGLADVVYGLAKQQAKNGHEVFVILPKYDLIPPLFLNSKKLYLKDLSIQEGDKFSFSSVYKIDYEGINLLLIDPTEYKNYFNQNLIYGALNDAERFLYFSKVATTLLDKETIAANIIHLHDWPSAAIAPLIRFSFPSLNAKIDSIIFTIHNIEHQGKVPLKQLLKMNFFNEKKFIFSLMQDPYKKEFVNLMKGAITYSDQVVTVSKSYAKEIKLPEFSFGLDKTILEYKDKIHGVMNGIDQESWNKENDPYLFENFPSKSLYIDAIIEKKMVNKINLFKELNLSPNDKGPLVICITRLASQKSPLLILKSIPLILKKKGSFILLGHICEKNLEEPFNDANNYFKNNPNVFLSYQFDDALAHKLYAAADMIFIPSKFEPCGLTQMIAMAYGTIAIASNTGGLKDSITDITLKNPTGFLFDELSENGIDKVFNEAFNIYLHEKNLWKTVMQNALERNFSWEAPSLSYDKIYKINKKIKTLA